jgi:hypothetical protein
MSADTWLDDNNRYLAASLQWLRLKLHRLPAGGPQTSEGGATEEPASQALPAQIATPLMGSAEPAGTLAGRRSWFGRGDAPATASAPAAASSEPAKAAVPPPAAPSARALDDAAAQRAAAARADPPPALLLLAERMGLSAFEADTLLLCAAFELDPGLAALVAAAQGQPTHSFPTFALALQLFDEPSWDALSPHRPLRYARLLEINQPGATPLTAAALRADERIVHYLKGLNAIDERLAALLAGDDNVGEAPMLSASQQAAADEAWLQLQATDPQGHIPLLALFGPDAASKLDVARTVCDKLGRRLYKLPLDALPPAAADIENLSRLWQRECLLLPVALYLDADELDRTPTEQAAALHTFVSRHQGLIFVGLREPPAKPLASALAVDVGRPTAVEQHQAWVQAMNGVVPEDEAPRRAEPLAGQFNMNLRDIRQAMGQAAAESPGDSPEWVSEHVSERVWAACCQRTRPKLDQLAQRIDARAVWGDLVLADDVMHLLRCIAEQVRHRYRVYEDWGYARKMNRGLGISALFAGESGTGKTMAAEVIANELKLGLYRIDLSAVVSKYIGETEKNLRKLFDAAEVGGAILLFDEADALFGKRSEVKDSHDRYANIEINYLLQRMEAFSGLAILATNMKSALDAAFLRRLRFVVNFQYPGLPERKRMWQQALPAGVPRDTALDFDRLARFNLSGGNIHSVALQAAFMAAAQDTGVTQAALLAAVRTELRKLDKPMHEGDFR